MATEVKVNKSEDLCTTCQEEIGDDQEAIQCDICERREHRLCIKACHRPTAEYCVHHHPRQVFTCSHCRCKGTLTCRLQQSEAALESAHVQIKMYDRLLEDKQRQIDQVTVEYDVLQLEKKQLYALLEEARQELRQIRLQVPGDISPEKPRLTETGVSTIITALMPLSRQQYSGGL